jgi:hypothetical protein
MAVVAAAAALVFAVATSGWAQGRPLQEVLYTPPIGNVDSLTSNTFEASFVSIGTAPIALTIQLCTLAGVCTSPGFACINVPLTRGKGCSTGNIVDNQPLYAKFFLKRTNAGTVDGLGSLRVIGPDGANSAAVQTTGSGLEKVPPTED